MPEASPENLRTLQLVLERANEFVAGWGGQLVFVYLPLMPHGDLHMRAGFTLHDQVVGMAAAARIPVIDRNMHFTTNLSHGHSFHPGATATTPPKATNSLVRRSPRPFAPGGSSRRPAPRTPGNRGTVERGNVPKGKQLIFSSTLTFISTAVSLVSRRCSCASTLHCRGFTRAARSPTRPRDPVVWSLASGSCLSAISALSNFD